MSAINTAFTEDEDNIATPRYSKEYDSQNDDDDDVFLLNFTENSDLYVISIDNVPSFYVKDEDTAYKKMWEVARMMSYRRSKEGYITNLIKGTNEVTISGSYRYFLISCEKTIHTINYKKIQECT